MSTSSSCIRHSYGISPLVINGPKRILHAGTFPDDRQLAGCMLSSSLLTASTSPVGRSATQLCGGGTCISGTTLTSFPVTKIQSRPLHFLRTRRIVSGSWDFTSRVWDPDTNPCILGPIGMPSGQVWAAVWSGWKVCYRPTRCPIGRCAYVTVTAGVSGVVVIVYDALSGRVRKIGPNGSSTITFTDITVVVSPDGSMVANFHRRVVHVQDTSLGRAFLTGDLR
ncbi:hypothetical protein BV22DRAFT_1034830 [Leucogyrophana mollusca]|uniref:Uncharacterized protein n=1 Tax=Leucogyrophana mollusca TaxID=85980 RepID=A0ACB8BHJ5_9AGAM|nr:hypothetical protein BV22DRAFT_1034830 [Leucogyrophana mollusca]